LVVPVFPGNRTSIDLSLHAEIHWFGGAVFLSRLPQACWKLAHSMRSNPRGLPSPGIFTDFPRWTSSPGRLSRPDRALRRRRGKSDTIDAEAAARAVLSGVATAAPKAGDGTVEMIRMLKTAKNSAVKARTQALNQIHAIVLTAPAALREELAELRTPALTERCASLRPGELSSPVAVARHTLRLLARRALALLAEVAGLNSQIEILAKLTAPRLIDTYGVGPGGAAALLLTAGDNPERLHSEAAFAALCGASPIPASSGKTNRHRLNRGGDRQANAALHRVVVVRLRWHQPTREYMARRLTQGKTKAEIIRCLKRYVAREIYHVLLPPVHDTLAAAA
jgi:transposase